MTKSILRDWVMEIPLMQQTALITAVRGHDGFPKHHPTKDIMRYYRRSILNMPMDDKETDDPFEKIGGNFNGPVRVESLTEAAENFIYALDEMSFHFYTHMLHGFEVLGYQHPVGVVREFWMNLYLRMCRKLNVQPEDRETMERRLSDNLKGWESEIDQSEKVRYT